MVIVILEIYNILINKEYLAWNGGIGNIFIYLFSIGIFCFVKNNFDKNNRIVEIISKYSFAIYLVHPFWINLIYKFFSVTPLNFPIILGIIIMFFIITVLSLVTAMVLKKLPIIKKYI